MRIAFTRELLCCGLAIKDDNLMRSSKSAALIVAIVVVLFFATLFGFRAYSRHEAARIAQELELAEEAKVMHQFEALVSEDTARTEQTFCRARSLPGATFDLN
jgi:predicted negative regulator of RcsB-dependent stress response